jgi:hypothetical protein
MGIFNQVVQSGSQTRHDSEKNKDGDNFHKYDKMMTYIGVYSQT